MTGRDENQIDEDEEEEEKMLGFPPRNLVEPVRQTNLRYKLDFSTRFSLSFRMKSVKKRIGLVGLSTHVHSINLRSVRSSTKHFFSSSSSSAISPSKDERNSSTSFHNAISGDFPTIESIKVNKANRSTHHNTKRLNDDGRVEALGVGDWRAEPAGCLHSLKERERDCPRVRRSSANPGGGTDRLWTQLVTLNGKRKKCLSNEIISQRKIFPFEDKTDSFPP